MQGISAGSGGHWIRCWCNMHRPWSNSSTNTNLIRLYNRYFKLWLTRRVQYWLLLCLLVESTSSKIIHGRVCRLISFFWLMIDTYVALLAGVHFNDVINFSLPLFLYLHLHYRVLLLWIAIALSLKLLLLIVLASIIALVDLILSH